VRGPHRPRNGLQAHRTRLPVRLPRALLDALRRIRRLAHAPVATPTPAACSIATATVDAAPAVGLTRALVVVLVGVIVSGFLTTRAIDGDAIPRWGLFAGAVQTIVTVVAYLRYSRKH
jgi:hypothetical protein